MSARVRPPLSASQRANIDKQRQLPLMGVTRPTGLPPGSWWLHQPRESFGQVAAAERVRMQWSKFARMGAPNIFE